jgi:exodeoxyribonuclease VII large subunit
LRQLKDRLAERAGRLGALSPLAVLERGYSIAHKLPEEHIVKSSAELQAGDRLRVSFAQGKALCRVEETE